MKKQLKTKLSLNKETIAKLNEEQMELVAGGQAIGTDATIVIGVETITDTDTCGSTRPFSTPPGSQTCPPTGTCCCAL
ncbi:class I lanthipeptide [Pedobacter sp. D749]|uniref:class I lanthipeptide n=1 Tax=Pedobacter sp. D749 TaxID=2856523 RepID=UPI001C577036|nr:class I lanthipeptide [Pedobacter sp. D749]QXU41489.1 class I lanthipeptide [Pedobacter sp. D749]